MKYLSLIALFTSTLFLSSCIKDDIINDFVEPQLIINESASEIEEGTSVEFSAMFLNNVGMPENINAMWRSSNESVATVNNDGLVLGVSRGNSTISVRYFSEDADKWFADSVNILVGSETVMESPVKTGSLRTTSQYTLQGDFEFEQLENGNLKITLADNYKASSNLPGLYVYLSNNPSTTNGALEISKVTEFSGGHSYEVSNVDINDYKILLYFCKPFNSKVGDGTAE